MFVRLLAFWAGRVYFVVRCDNPAAFINRALKARITLFRIERSEHGLRAQVALRDFARLRPVARAVRAHVKIVARYGWPFIAARWWRRKGLLTGIVLIAVTLSILSQLVLFISVSGNKTIGSAEILQKARVLGLKTWVPSGDLDLNRIATGLEESLPDAAWVGVGRKGTHVQIEVVEKIRPRTKAEDGNLVASKTGLVQQVIVIQGIAQVHEGEMVQKGQVLIAKALPAAPLNPLANSKVAQPVAKAEGFVRARVWYSAEANVPLKEDKIVPTGKVSSGWGIKIGTRVIMVTTPDSPYAMVRKDVAYKPLLAWRNWRFPVELVTINYEQLQQVHIERSPQEARQEAEGLARTEVRSKITPGVTLLEEKVRVLSSTDKAIRVRVEEETYEDLAVYPEPNGGA